MYVVHSVHLFSFSRHASYFPQEVVLTRSLYISPKDSKTYYTFYDYCKKNIYSFRRVLYRQENGRHQQAYRQRGKELTDERQDASAEGHPVHLPVALREVDGERDDDAARHCRQRAEMEDSEQHARHVERGREQSAHEQALRVARRLEDGAGRGQYDLNPYGQRQNPENGYGRQPLVAEDDQRHFLRREEEQHAERQSDEGEKAQDAFVGGGELPFVVLKIAEYRVHHGGDHLCDVLQGKHHQTVRFFVVSQVGHSHVFAYQQLVKVTAEIVDDIEQELVGGIGEYLAQHGQPQREAQALRIALVGDGEYQYAGYYRVDNQRIQSRSAECCGDGGGSCGNLDDEAADSDELEFLVAVEQSSRHDGGGGEKQVDGQQLAQCPQDVAVVIIGYQPRCGEEEDAYAYAGPHGERENIRQFLPCQRLVLHDGGGYAHVREQVEEGDDYGGYRHDAEVVRREQACQHPRHHERDDDAAVFGERRVEHSGEELTFEITCHSSRLYRLEHTRVPFFGYSCFQWRSRSLPPRVRKRHTVRRFRARGRYLPGRRGRTRGFR